MNYDFTTLAGVKAVAESINETADKKGVDFDLEIRPEENKVRAVFWVRGDDGKYKNLFATYNVLTPEGVNEALWSSIIWLAGYEQKEVADE